jgi:hypothetical protein
MVLTVADERTPDERIEDVDEDAWLALWDDRDALFALAGSLNDDQRWIEAALGDRNQLYTDGRRMTSEEYWDWRNKANVARVKKVNAYRRIKARVLELDRSKPRRDHEHRWQPLGHRQVPHPTTGESTDAILHGCYCGDWRYAEMGGDLADHWLAWEPA